MKSVEGTPEEHPGALTNNNGSLSCKIPPEKTSIFRSTRFFMVVFLSGWIMQGMYMTYFVSEITTIEKLFQIESKTTGVLLAATEIGQICTSLFLTYFAGRGHRPRWIALMMLVLALGVLGCVVPHIMYGTALLNARSDNTTAETLCLLEEPKDSCKADVRSKQEDQTSITAVVMPWFFVCLLITGVGQTGIATLGIPYIDDNVGSRQSPLYMAITIGVRLIGPAMGFVLGSLCARVYVQPGSPPPYGPSDPRWVGAWWLGMVIISTVIMSLAMFMLCFPKQIKKDPNAAQVKLKYEREKAKTQQPFFADFFATIKRQLTNDILMCRTASSVLHLMPISGLYIFLPKYLETQFKLASYEANLITGIGGIFITGVAIIVSGIVILKFVPTARQVAAWTAATAFLYAAGMVLLMFVSCPTEDFAGLKTSTGTGYLANMPSNNMLPLTPPCQSACRCDNSKYNAICGQDGHTYFSACHAGCHNVKKIGDRIIYYNCECIDNRTMEQFDTLNSSTINMLNDEEFDSNLGYANSGYCHGNCKQLYLFIVIFSLVMCIHASGEVGSVLLIIRCTDAKDKAMAMGVIQFAIGVFGNVPCPIIFGAVVDSACMFWDKTCGVKGACFHYNMDQFRHFFLGLTAGIMFLAFIMDLFVWHKASRIDINPEEHQQNPIGPDASTEPLVTSQDPVLVPLTSTPTDTQV